MSKVGFLQNQLNFGAQREFLHFPTLSARNQSSGAQIVFLLENYLNFGAQRKIFTKTIKNLAPNKDFLNTLIFSTKSL